MINFLDFEGLKVYNAGVVNIIKKEATTINTSLNDHLSSKNHIPVGGSPNFILAKISAADQDVSWVENSIKCPNSINKSFLLGSPDQVKISGEANTNVACYMENGILFSSGITSTGEITGSRVFNAVFNDLADSIEVNDTCEVAPGYCYCFNGNSYYKTTEYMEPHNIIMGIHSDTYGFNMGKKGRTKELDIAVAGFVLAYVDKEYSPGTPLTCTKNGYLTELKEEDLKKRPDKLVGIYWKYEKNSLWGLKDKTVKVNGRHWVKIK